MANQSYSKHFVPPAPLNPNYKSSLTLVLVDSLDKLKDSFQYGKVVAWDTETTGLNPEQSEIVGFSYSFDGKTAYYCPVKHIDIHLGKDALDAFYEMLTKSKMQLLYNARFDIRMMEYSGYDMSFLYAKDDKGKSTYKFIDVMNAVWLADTNITMPTLKASTLHFLGYQPPKFLETLGSEANFQYVPSADAYEYACLDAANTYNLFKAVYPYFKEAGLSAQLDNACTYIIGQLEKQTLKLDLNYFVNLRDEISENISELKKKIYAIAGHEFNISSGRELTHVFLEQGIDTGERTKAGDMKTSIKMLSLYKKYHPECELMDLLVEYKEKIKCYNSYLKTLVEIASKQNEVPPRFSYKLQSVPCLTDRNVVMLKDIGLVSVSQVQADDYIWTQYGYKKVLWCHEHKVDEVYQVIFDNGSIIEGTDKHPVLVNKGNDTNIDVEWATLESLKDGEEVIFNHHTPLIKFSNTKDDTSAVFSLYMGVLASYYLNDNVKDLQAYKETVQALTEHQNKEDREILFHVITHAEAIMKEVVGFSPTEMVCFLQGIYALLFQLDESRYWNRSLEDDTFSIVINRNPITPLILNILKFLGIASRLDKSESSDTWKITIYSKQGCTLFKYLIVDGIDLFALQDLFEHYNPSGIYKEYASSKVLKKTIKKDVVSVYDIEVEGVHEYIANGVVTHNTGRLSCLSGDSKIHTIMGDIPIRELSQYEQGNEVYIDPNTTASFKTLYMGKKPCFKVEMETGEILYATPDHQFLDSSTEWKRVDALKVGDKLLHSTRVLSSSNVKSITEDKEQDVYTLSVNHYRHQYVSDNLISHNCGKDGKNSYFSPINLQSIPKPKSTKCFGRLATQEEIDNKQDLMGWIFSDEHPEWSVGKVVEGMSPKGNVRMGFIPENGKDDYLVSIDMSSEELRVVTNLYQEHSWADVIKSGGDLHHRNSDAIFGAENYTKETRKRAKCLSGKSLVFTDKGILPIQDLCDIREEGIPYPVNYKISTPEGINNITHFIYNGFKKTKLITFKDGTSLEATYDHIVQSNNKLIKVEELSIGDFVDCGSNLIEVSKYQEVSLPFIKGCRLTITEDIAYLLGAILGDGSLSCKNVKYFSIDKELIEEIKRIVHSLNLSNKEPYIENMYRNKIPRNTPMTIINCGSKRLLVLLECLGINKENHKNLIVPEVIFKSPSSVKGKFIRGLFDTDGWVTKSGLSIGFCSKSLSFTQDIHYLLLSLGIKNTVYSSFNKVYNRDYYKIRIARSSSKQFYEVVGFCNNRKRELLENHLSKLHSKNSMPFKKEIIKIEDSESDVFDLTVDNKSHLFYANGCIVHNCAAFGMLYGQGPKGFQSNFPDMTLDEAKEFLTKFKKIIPNIISGQDRDIRIARQTGTVYTSFHRPRRVKADLQSTDKREVAFGERTVKNCYSPDTEFLTEYGWLLAKDIKPDTLIAYYEPNVGKVFYTNAGERYTNSCTESIICSSNKTSWDVTTNHRMWVRLKDEHKWEFIEARELLDNREFYYKDNSYLSESFCDMSDYINSSFGCLPKSLVFAIIANYISELYSFNAPKYDKETLLNSCIKDIINRDDLISYLDSDNDFINSMLEIIENEEKNGFKDILKSSLSDRLVFINSLNYYIGRDKNERLCRVIMSKDKKYLDSIQIIMNMSGFTSHIKETTKETLSLYSLYYDFDSSNDVPLTSKDITLVKHEKPIEYSCFNVPSHILITRHKGFISYHGNTGIQGTAADVLKLEFIRLWDNIFTKYPEVKFHSTIHDEINFSVPRKLAREVIPIMIKCMTVTMPNWLVALDCSLSIGYNLGSLIPFKYNAETQEFIPDWEEDLRKEKKEDEEPINEYEDDEDSQDSIEDIEQDSIDYRMYDL